MNTTHEEKKATQELLHKTRIYLLDNFHKFSEFNKIKIALALILKAMPTTIEGIEQGAGETRIVIIRPDKTDLNKTDDGQTDNTKAIPGQVSIQQ